jgi:hypothetical protein
VLAQSEGFAMRGAGALGPAPTPDQNFFELDTVDETRRPTNPSFPDPPIEITSHIAVAGGDRSRHRFGALIALEIFNASRQGDRRDRSCEGTDE